jgi:hypothetical protein
LKTYYIAVDFDGTIAEHEFPEIGKPVPEAFNWLAKFQHFGIKLILWTMRSDSDKSGPVLTQAVEFCRQHGIEFAHVNENPQGWTTSPKAYAHAYIDDAAIGCPLRQNPRLGGRPFVDWAKVGPMVAEQFGLPIAPSTPRPPRWVAEQDDAYQQSISKRYAEIRSQ